MKFNAEGAIKPMPNKDKIQNKDVLNKSADDLIKILKVFERLEVGPVKLEPKPLIAPYRLFYNGKMEQTELIYSYEETVFDPAEPESQNLADMIATRVHYGVKRRKVVSERTRLEAQLRRMVDQHRNRESSQSGEEDDPTPDDRDRSE